jgi:hypothetical protein
MNAGSVAQTGHLDIVPVCRGSATSAASTSWPSGVASPGTITLVAPPCSFGRCNA